MAGESVGVGFIDACRRGLKPLRPKKYVSTCGRENGKSVDPELKCFLRPSNRVDSRGKAPRRMNCPPLVNCHHTRLHLP